MKLIVKNNSDDAYSFASGSVTIAANTNPEINSKYWYPLLLDSTFHANLKSNNLILNDGVQDYHYPESRAYLEKINSVLSNRDSDGSPLSRTKVTTTGWHLQLHVVEFSSSKRAVDHSSDIAGAPIGFATMKAYKDNGSGGYTLITDDEELSLAIKTEFFWEPTHDYEIVGAKFYQLATPSSDVRMWTVGVPDVPAVAGGSKVFVQGGLNLKFINAKEVLDVDGRAPKYMTYNAIYHTNKFSLVFKHDAGLVHSMMIAFEIFKA